MAKQLRVLVDSPTDLPAAPIALVCVGLPKPVKNCHWQCVSGFKSKDEGRKAWKALLEARPHEGVAIIFPEGVEKLVTVNETGEPVDLKRAS